MSEIERLIEEIDAAVLCTEVKSPNGFMIREGMFIVRRMAEAIVLERSYHSLRRAGYSE